jgi:hypothetical protein
LVGALLGSLASLPAGPDRPANIGAADLAAACAEGERDAASGFLSSLRSAGVRADEADTVCRVLTTRTGGGQLGVSSGGRRGPVTVNWVDTPDGRYALRRTGGWVTVTPVDLPRLSAMAEELL